MGIVESGVEKNGSGDVHQRSLARRVLGVDVRASIHQR